LDTEVVDLLEALVTLAYLIGIGCGVGRTLIPAFVIEGELAHTRITDLFVSRVTDTDTELGCRIGWTLATTQGHTGVALLDEAGITMAYLVHVGC